MPQPRRSQSSACEEALKSLEEQEKAIEGCSQGAESLEALADELKTSSNIGKSAEDVAGNAEELSATVEEMSKAAAQILIAIEQISKGADQQASSADQGANRLEKLKSGAEEANEIASVALERGREMLEVLTTNKASIDDMIVGISTAVEDGKQNLERMKEIEELSQLIDKVVDGIANVAIQTSMLAVTGAVEAARAGEFGKGFAVVSTDIENLANEAMENAEQIKDMVKGIQVQTATVLADLQNIAKTTLDEVAKAKATTASLITIESDTKGVVTGNQEIQKAAGEIPTAVDQAREGTEQIAAAAEQARKATDQASAAAKQQSQGAEDLAAAVEEIASIADEIQSS